MTLGIGVDWPQMLDDAGATALAEHVVDLLKQLGHKKLFKYEEELGTRPIGYFLSLPNPTEDREHDGGFLLSPSKWKFGAHLKVPPVDFGVWTTTKGNLREHRDLRWAELVAELPQQTEAQLLQRLERMVHLTVPRRICIGPIDVVRTDSERRSKRRGALIYINAKGVALAKKLELGLKIAPGAAGGGWIRSHDKGLDADSDVETAFEIVAAALGRIDRVEYEERYPKQTAGPAKVGAAYAPQPRLGAVTLIAATPPPPEGVRPFDPEETLLPVRQQGPALPFHGTITEDEARARFPPPASDTALSGMTLPLMAPRTVLDQTERVVAEPGLAERLTREVIDRLISSMTLEVFSKLRAALAVRGENDAGTLRDYGLSSVTKDAVQRHFHARFVAEPALRDEFQRLFSIELAQLRNDH